MSCSVSKELVTRGSKSVNGGGLSGCTVPSMSPNQCYRQSWFRMYGHSCKSGGMAGRLSCCLLGRSRFVVKCCVQVVGGSN